MTMNDLRLSSGDRMRAEVRRSRLKLLLSGLGEGWSEDMQIRFPNRAMVRRGKLRVWVGLGEVCYAAIEGPGGEAMAGVVGRGQNPRDAVIDLRSKAKDMAEALSDMIKEEWRR